MAVQYSISVGEIASIALAIAALLLALAALRISGDLARKSASRPFVVEKLYELYQYRKNRRLDPQGDVAADIDRLFKEVQMVTAATLILEAAGFRQRLEEVEAKDAAYWEIHRELSRSDRRPSEEEARKLTDAAVSLDQAIQDLLSALEPQMKRALKNPLDDFKN